MRGDRSGVSGVWDHDRRCAAGRRRPARARGRRMKRAAWLLLLLIAFAALGAPWLSPNPPNLRFDDLLYAPPTRIHVLQDGMNAPFIYRWRVASRLERRFVADESSRVSLRW